MTKNNSDVAVEQLKKILRKDSEKTKQVLVEFYEEDWIKLKELKEQADVSWKEFFRAISILWDTLGNNPDAEKVVMGVIHQDNGKGGC